VNDLPSTEIVSEIFDTPAGQAWVERDGLGRLWVRCGDHLYLPQHGMAPALGALVEHVQSCEND
jgi:hypothetical protein